MNATEESLGSIQTQALVIQASKDNTVDPSSGSEIFEKLGTLEKRLVILERERHGIINGAGSHEVFIQVEQFLNNTLKQEQAKRYWLMGRRMAALFSRFAGRFSPSSEHAVAGTHPTSV